MLNIAIISIYPFPNGLAPTNRIKAYAYGLVENNSKVTVYIPFPTDNMPKIQGNSGVFNGINYIYTSGRYKSSSYLIRGIAVVSGLRKILGYITSAYHLLKYNRDKAIDILIISTDSLSNLFFYSFLARICKSKAVFIYDEFPIPIRHKLKSKIPALKELLYKFVLRRISAYISISSELKEFYCGLQIKPSLILPVIIDTSRFINIDNNFTEVKKYICYMGNMELSKDDVDNIIIAFSKIISNFDDIELHLYGKPNDKDFKILRDLINELNLKDYVFFNGIADYERVPSILRNATILVSSQPDTKRASGGFPTKLGEYLASGVPSIFSDVGENSKYVKDSVHIFFAKPSNPNDFAEKISYILRNYHHALEVSEAGKMFVMDNYSHVTQGEKLYSFLKSLS